MSHFLIQNKGNVLSKEAFDLKEILDSKLVKATKLHTYELVDDILLSKYDNIDRLVPVGTIDFVEKFLLKYASIRGIKLNTSKEDFRIKPIEVPECLRKPEFLLRDYNIVSMSNLTNRYSFIKNASILKQFSCVGFREDYTDCLSDKCMYVQSSVIDILSEYRVLVFNDEVVAVQHYDGDPLVFPDSYKIIKMVNTIKLSDNYPKAYTLDIAVTSKGTCVLEQHNFVACGTYGYCGSTLLNMYIAGINYEKEVLMCLI